MLASFQPVISTKALHWSGFPFHWSSCAEEAILEAWGHSVAILPTQVCSPAPQLVSDTPMFVPAQEGDLPYIRALIRDGARSGSFDEELAGDCPESDLFFAGLSEVIVRKVWTRPPAMGLPTHTRALIVLYLETAVSKASGFVAIREIGRLGYELWLTAVDPGRRGCGVGRKMVTDFLATKEGRLTRVAQCRIGSVGAQACAHILGSVGFTAARVGLATIWMARSDLPADTLHWMETAPFVSRAAT